MPSLLHYTSSFQRITERVLGEMFGVADAVASVAVEMTSVKTRKSFIVSLYYTGTVYGEYLLAMDEDVAARIVGIDEAITDVNRDEVRSDICDALTETLNVIVGEAIVDLQDCFAKLTITAPRVYFGEIRYPQFRTGKSVLQTPMGEIECLFCLDQMRLSLASSYEEAVSSLVQINVQLKDANRRLAEHQRQLIHAEKMASIGVLASGVAHEINTPLFLVDMNLAVLDENVALIEAILRRYEELESALPERGQRTKADDDFNNVLNDTREVVNEAREGVGRIKLIVGNLKEFGDIDCTGLSESNLNLIAKNATNLVSHLLPAGSTIEHQLSDLPTVHCNAGEIGQVLANILTNACQAIGENGRIVLRSESGDDDVLLVVEDNGVGIAEEHLDRLFDPFYTTKEVGEGTGLGLSISYGLVKKHFGSISIESTPTVGTKVTVRLPVAAHAACCS